MYSELTNILLACSSPDQAARSNAEMLLERLQQTDFKKFIQLLCGVMATPHKPAKAIMMAGILLKNSIDAKSTELKLSQQNRWVSIPENERAEIRATMLQILTSEIEDSRNIAALVVAKVAAVELNKGNWTELPKQLIQMAQSSQPHIIISALKTLGILFEEAPQHIPPKAKAVMELCCSIYISSQNSPPLKKACVRTIFDALEFADEVFSVDKSQEIAMNVLLKALNSGDVEECSIALDCLCRVGEIFYQDVGKYLPPILQTTRGILSNVNSDLSIKLRSIEFWTVLAEIEANVFPADNIVHCNYIRPSLPTLIPALLFTMVHIDAMDGEPEPDDEPLDSPAANSAGGCLGLVAQCSGDDLLPHLVPFLKENFNDGDWRKQEAALSALGIVMEGPSKNSITSLLEISFDGIIQRINSSNPYLRDAASWAFARACSSIGKEMAYSDKMEIVIQLTMSLIKDPRPSVAANGCLAVNGLTESIASVGTNQPSSPMSNHFKMLSETLMTTAGRMENESNLQTAAFEALNTLILNCAVDCEFLAGQMVTLFLRALNSTLSESSPSSPDSFRVTNLQAHLIGVISSVVKRVPENILDELIDGIMDRLVTVLQSNDKTIFEEVLLAVGVIVNKIGPKFTPFVHKIHPFLMMGLGESLGSDVCKASAGVIGDLFRSLGAALLELGFADPLVEKILILLQSPKIDRKIKPTMISAFGDLALSTEHKFIRYVPAVINTLTQMASTQYEESDFEGCEVLCEMRASLFETFGMILLALKGGDHLSELAEKLGCVLPLIGQLIRQPYGCNDAVIAAALNFIGDVAKTMGSQSKPMLKNPLIYKLKEMAETNSDQSVREALGWAKVGIRNAFSSSSSFKI